MEIDLKLEKVSQARVPTKYGDFSCHVYRTANGDEHVVFVSGDLKSEQVLVRVHSECVTGDVFGSIKCDCGEQLDAAMSKIAKESGVLIYLRGQEGRGIGLAHKIDAYKLQEQGLDTVDANIALGLPVDSREYRVAAEILKDLKVSSARLITNNPEKLYQLREHGIQVDRESIPTVPNSENVEYLRTKKDKLGHLIEGLEDLGKAE